MAIQEFPISNTRKVLANDKSTFQRDVRQEPPKAKEIQNWIVNYLGTLLEINPDEINVSTSFDRYGLDSAAAVGMIADLEDWLNRELDPTLVYDYPNIEILAQHLAEDSAIAA